jgi:hypothetical protein
MVMAAKAGKSRQNTQNLTNSRNSLHNGPSKHCPWAAVLLFVEKRLYRIQILSNEFDLFV